MTRRPLFALPAVAAALLLTACGSEGIELPGSESDPAIQRGAQLFQQRCSGCHTLDVAGTQGSAVNPNSREYKDGPNFNTRVETYDQVLYAIRNGGFSSGPMPQNIVVGENAKAVAKFVAKYSGSEVARAPDSSKPAPAGATGDSPVESPQTTPSGADSGGSDPSTAQPGETPVGGDATPTPTPTP